MRLTERLYLGKNEVEPVDVLCNLSYRNPGTATVVVKTKPQLKQIVAYELGYDGKLTRYFMGYVESFKEMGDGRYSLFCRELSAFLRHSLPVFAQHWTLAELLASVTSMTGLTFVVPDRDYAKTPAPFIVNHATGYALMDALGDVFGIERYLWQQMGDGRIFVGSWNDSMWAGKVVPVPAQYLKNAQADSAQIPTLPALRPGALVNGVRVRDVELHKEKMQIQWMS